jgi:hypothetical protein
MDFLTLVLILAAVPTAWQIAARWEPQSADRSQLQLETRAETAAIKVRFGQTVFFLSGILLILGICLVLPAVVPGAMCGTGVLEATDGLGGRALVLRFLTVAILVVWWVLDQLNRTQPMAPLTKTNARVVLVVVPVLLLSVLGTFKALSRLEGHPPVACCAVVYEHVSAASRLPTVSDHLLVWLFGVATVGVLACGLACWLNQSPVRRTVVPLLAVMTVGWAVVAVSTLIRVFSVYHYQVLNHHCPWCLFLPQHGFIGFFLFGALGLAVLEAAIAWVTDRVGQTYPDLASPALKRCRAAGLRIVVASLVFGGLAGIPPILWRLRFGVWMG